MFGATSVAAFGAEISVRPALLCVGATLAKAGAATAAIESSAAATMAFNSSPAGPSARS